MSGLSKSHIPSLKQIYSGKVRDCYAVGEDKLLLVASDRISAFDVILGDPIPGKGKVLTALTNFWFEKLKDVIPNHLTGIAPESVVKPEEVDQVKGRAVVSKRLDDDGNVLLMDEVLTPDSSRFWPADSYEVGTSPKSFDKQYIRDWLETQPWNKTPPAPKLPEEVIEKTADKYREALRRLTGTDIEP